MVKILKHVLEPRKLLAATLDFTFGVLGGIFFEWFLLMICWAISYVKHIQISSLDHWYFESYGPNTKMDQGGPECEFHIDDPLCVAKLGPIYDLKTSMLSLPSLHILVDG